MRFVKFLYKIPYSLAWRIANTRNYSFPVIFYCTDLHDLQVFEPIRKKLPELTIVSKNIEIQNLLFEKGISSILKPVYPQILITIKDEIFMFPSDKILKIRIQNDSVISQNLKVLLDYQGYNLYLSSERFDENNSSSAAKYIINYAKDWGISF